jgi:isopentenyl-diphosphate delta-isomerase
VTDEVKARKIEHVTLALEKDISAPQQAGWHDIRFIHQALPEVNLDEIDTSVTFLGHTLSYPIFMSSLTGGHPDVMKINKNLARAAERYNVALGVGSQRAAIVNPQLSSTYTVTRQHAPNTFLIANIGAPQLISQDRHDPFTQEQIQQAIQMIEANALAVHLNSLQEAAQPEGDRHTRGEVEALTALTQQLSLPVIAKETGAGICYEQAIVLRNCGIAAIDVGGAGGSSMSALEAARAQKHNDERAMNIGLLFRDWGIPTPIAVVETKQAQLPVISTGGVRSGLDIARAIALGATLVGIGHPFLQAASESFERVCEVLDNMITELKVAMQLSGSTNLQQLGNANIIVTGATHEWLNLRGFKRELKHMSRRRWQVPPAQQS